MADFSGQKFNIKRIGTDGDTDVAADLLSQWDTEADAIGLGGLNFNYSIQFQPFHGEADRKRLKA